MASTSPWLRGTVLAVVESLPWRSVLADLAVVLMWFTAVSFGFSVTSWPTWLYYLVVFGGVVGYSLRATRSGQAPITVPDT